MNKEVMFFEYAVISSSKFFELKIGVMRKWS